MPYTQLLSMHPTGEQLIPTFYNQDPAVNDFGAPSTGSLDSGFDEVDPFEKRNLYHTGNDVDFARTCSMNRQSTAPMDFGAFGYAPALHQRINSDFGVYPPNDLTASFQPSTLVQVDPYGRYQASPGMEDTSEDGRTASMCSESPQQGTFGVDSSPRIKLESSWPAKQQTNDSSLAETKHVSDERAAPKAAPARGRPRKRIPHTAVERRYRENLNAHLERLRAAVPNLTAAQRRKSTDGSDPMKPSKCEVLMGAVDYIKRLETENDRLKRKSSV